MSTSNGKRVKVAEWKSPRSGIVFSIEIATEEDRDLLEKFLNEQTRVQEPIIASMGTRVGEMSNVFEGMIDRSVGSGLTLLMFNEEKDLIGIRMASKCKMPEKKLTGEFKLLPDYKDLIDRQPGSSRKNQQVSALMEIMYGWAPSFLPDDCEDYFCMELINLMPQYRNEGLATKLYQELFKVAASKGLQFGEVICTAKASQRVCHKLGMRVKLEIDYDKFLDGGQVCVRDTNDGSQFCQLLIADLKEMGYFE
ncbi:hypothetical protein M3Y97_00204000 [Aphelenchoides bicaudatus]|nr:hypothetical protein M3Y97_00204000 [Aphelenchoides bicaudatus]